MNPLGGVQKLTKSKGRYVRQMVLSGITAFYGDLIPVGSSFIVCNFV